jgi:5-methylcytosine-specific restriction protein B
VLSIVQFHPSYSYEEFILGIRPETGIDGSVRYPLVPGRFLEFCEQARERRGRSVLIIDEINRADLPRVFGELMYLLEYRDAEVTLAGGRRFGIPPGVRIIGTMNTADRSIALVDSALRRRFAFLPLGPETEILRHYHRRAGTGFDIGPLIDIIERLNREIENRQYQLGISYFLRNDLETSLPSIWRLEIEPYLEEFFYDRPELVERYRWERLGL